MAPTVRARRVLIMTRTAMMRQSLWMQLSLERKQTCSLSRLRRLQLLHLALSQ